MAGSRFLLNPQDAKRAVMGYRECAGDATATLKAMLGQVDELVTKHAGPQADGLKDIAEELKIRINRLIAQVDSLSSIVQSADRQYGPSDADIAQTFKTTINTTINKAMNRAMNAGDTGGQAPSTAG